MVRYGMVQCSQSVSQSVSHSVTALHTSPPKQSRSLNWGPVLQASLIRAPATSGLIGKGLA